jgi:hypothetical protein
VRQLRSVLLIGLFLVPIVLHGHRHDALRASAGRCAVCVAAHHTPAVGAPPVAPSSPAVAVYTVHARPATAPAKGERPSRTGRGPPSSSVSLDV